MLLDQLISRIQRFKNKNEIRMKNADRLVLVHLNTNSLRNKFEMLEEIIKDNSTSTNVHSLKYFFLKRCDMLSLCLVLSITKKIFSYSLVLEQQPFIAL